MIIVYPVTCLGCANIRAPSTSTIKMASLSANPGPDPLGKGSSHPMQGETPFCGGEPSQGIQEGTKDHPGGPGTNTGITHLISSFSAINFEDSKTSLVQLFHILGLLGIETKTIRYFDPPRPSHMTGIFCKNIFLKDRKGQFYFVICNETTDIDLKKLKSLVRAHRNFSFASTNDLDLKLALTPGAVSPFGLINDPEHSVRFIVDKAMVKEAREKDVLLNFHPIVDFLTTLMSVDDLMKFVAYCGHEAELVDL